MKLVVDENIVQGKEAFNSFGEVIFLGGRKITNEVLSDVDVLIVRSITNVNEELLKNTKVKFVGTATIGTDHIDLGYLKENDISFSSAAVCNSYSVAEYVLSAITYFANKDNFVFSDKSIGIIGYGNIGTKLAKIATVLGMKVVINDPPKERVATNNIFSSFEEAIKCDIITFHVPLNFDGIDKTVHMLNATNLNLIKENAILINSSRGPVVSNEDLEEKLKQNKNFSVVLDVWEQEPNFNLELFNLVDIGTPHIAGYSYEGKVNGTQMIYEALSDYLGTQKIWTPKLATVEESEIEISSTLSIEAIIKKILDKSYNIIEDDELLRKSVLLSEKEKEDYFDSLRKNYKTLRELNNFQALFNNADASIVEILKTLRLKINS